MHSILYKLYDNAEIQESMYLSIKHSLYYTDIYEYVYDLPDIPIPNYSM